MMKKHWLAAAWILALLLLSPGCVTWDEPLVPPPHGIPVSLDEVPPSVIAPASFPKEPKRSDTKAGHIGLSFPMDRS